MKMDTPWRDVSSPLLGITEMMDYFRDHLGVKYEPQYQGDLRRKPYTNSLKPDRSLANPDNPFRSVNSPDPDTRLKAALKLIRPMVLLHGDLISEAIFKSVASSKKLHATEREMVLIPVKLPNGDELKLTPGGQNELIKPIIEELCPRYLPDGIVVYMDDAGPKRKEAALEYLKEQLGIKIDIHGKMPDVIVHMPGKGWVDPDQAVTSHGPIDIRDIMSLKDPSEKPDLGLSL